MSLNLFPEDFETVFRTVKCSSELQLLDEVLVGELCKAPALVGGKEDVVTLEGRIKVLICGAAAVGDATIHIFQMDLELDLVTLEEDEGKRPIGRCSPPVWSV